MSTSKNYLSVDVLVIGAGQAGLAVGYYLKQTKLNYVLLDSAPRVGDSWANRYDSLKLFTKRAYTALPGMPLTGEQYGYPIKDEIVEYLKKYATHFDLPIRLSETVTRVTPQENGFLVTTNNGQEYQTRELILAAGAFQKPFVPDVPGRTQASLNQWHSSSYKNPAQLSPGPVLIVGGGNSGTQIAYELAQSHDVVLSVNKPLKFVGTWYIDIVWGIARFETLQKLLYSRAAKRLHSSVPVNTVIGKECQPYIRDGRISMKGKISNICGKDVFFEDGSQQQFQTIIWATGFELDLSWLDIPHLPQLRKDNASQILNARPGLHYIYRSRHSEFLGWVKRDAERIVKAIRQ